MFVMYKTPNTLREKSKVRDKLEKIILLMYQNLSKIPPYKSEDELLLSVLTNNTYVSLYADVHRLIQYEERLRKPKESGGEVDEPSELQNRIFQLHT